MKFTLAPSPPHGEVGTTRILKYVVNTNLYLAELK
jgi:hypothetical protein